MREEARQRTTWHTDTCVDSN